jgi:hypothetical protein
MATRLPRAEQQIQEAVPLLAVVAEGEQLLELVDDHPGVQLTVLGNERRPVRAGGPLARGEDPDHRRSAGALALPQLRDEAGPQQ